MGVRLPAEYQEVEYIEGTGTQYINTGVILQTNGGFEVCAKFESNTVSWDDGTIRYICGSRKSYASNRCTIQTEKISNGYRVETGNNLNVLFGQSIDPLQLHVFKILSNGIYVDGELKSTDVSIVACQTHFLIFNISNTDTDIPSQADVGARFWHGPIYYLKLFDSSEDVSHHYIPCYRKSDDKPGMYDLVTRTFFTNQGTGEFEVGPDVIDTVSPWLMNYRRSLLSLRPSPVLDTATGNPLTFTTNMTRPLKSLVVPFSPIQEGTGDPSPSNVRPISGWTGANVCRATVNILGEKDANGYFPVVIPAGKSIVVSYKGNTTVTVRFYRADKTQISYLYVQSVSGDYRYRIVSTTDLTEPVYYIKFDTDYPEQQCCFGNVFKPYEEPSLTTIPINWQSSAGTIYGGTVTLNEDRSADVQPTKQKYTFDGSSDESWALNYQGNTDPTTYRAVIRVPNTANYKGDEVANYLVGIGGFTPTLWTFSVDQESNARLMVGVVNTITTADDWKAYLATNPLEVVLNYYTLPDPIHIPNVGSLYTYLGTNTIWTDTNGTNTATYWKYNS